jgi:hypothetical protein
VSLTREQVKSVLNKVLLAVCEEYGVSIPMPVTVEAVDQPGPVKVKHTGYMTSKVKCDDKGVKIVFDFHPDGGVILQFPVG